MWASGNFLSIVGVVTKSCPTLHDPMDCGQPGSSVHVIVLGKRSEVGRHFLLERIFPTQGSNLHLLLGRWVLLPLSHVGSLILFRSHDNPAWKCRHHISALEVSSSSALWWGPGHECNPVTSGCLCCQHVVALSFPPLEVKCGHMICFRQRSQSEVAHGHPRRWLEEPVCASSQGLVR